MASINAIGGLPSLKIYNGKKINLDTAGWSA